MMTGTPLLDNKDYHSRVFKITKKKVDESVLNRMWTDIRLAASNSTEMEKRWRCAPDSKKLITHLVLYRNEMGDEMVKKLCEGLEEFHCLSLHIWANALTDVSAITLSHSLRYSFLESLDLSKNQITDIGALSIAKNMKNSNLSSLDLSYNPVSDGGLMSILTHLNLFHLHLIGCHVTQKGADYLIDKLQSCDKSPGNVKLLENVEISLETHVMIEMALERRRILQKQAAKELIKFAQVFHRIYLPFPAEIKDMILDTQLDPSYCSRDKKLLKQVLFSPLYRGWIKSSRPFSKEELLRICRFLQIEKDTFKQIYRLRHECKTVSKKYYDQLKQIESNWTKLKWTRIYSDCLKTVSQVLGPFGFALSVTIRAIDIGF